jgi:hypothetical protein
MISLNRLGLLDLTLPASYLNYHPACHIVPLPIVSVLALCVLSALLPWIYRPTSVYLANSHLSASKA